MERVGRDTDGCGSAGTERVVVGGSRVGMEWGSSFMLGHDGNLGWVSVGVGNGGCGVGDERARREGVRRSWVQREGTEEGSATSVERDGTRLVCCVGLACCGCGCWGDRAH